MVPGIYLISERTLKVTVFVDTPYISTVQAVTQILIPSTNNGRIYCGPCQLNDRTLCVQFNGICWNNYLDYNISYPFVEAKCLKAMSSICYNVWKRQDNANKECDDFNSYYSFTLMGIKPNVTSAAYSDDGKSVVVTFNTPIWNDTFIECSDLLAEETLKWLPSSRSGIWLNKYTLSIAYEPQTGIMSKIIFKANSIFYDYIYASAPMDLTSFPIKMSPINVQLYIKAPNFVSQCDSLRIDILNMYSTLYILNFRFNITYDKTNAGMSSDLIKEANQYFNQFTSISKTKSVVIPQKYLKNDSIISVKVETFIEGDSTVVNNGTRKIEVIENAPKISFSFRNQFILEIESDIKRMILVLADNSKCVSSSLSSVMATETKFQVISGQNPYYLVDFGKSEDSIAATLTEMFTKSKQLVLSISQGFQYYTFYLLIATMTDTETGKSVSDTIIVRFIKPPIKSIIEGGGSLVNIEEDVRLNGDRSVFPDAKVNTSGSSPFDDIITYKWNCVKNISLVTGITCSCPVIDYVAAAQSQLVISKEKFVAFCSYTFRLSVGAKNNYSSRTAYNETDFVAYKGPITPVRGKLIKGSQMDGRDLYFTFEMNSTDNISNVKYEWNLIEINCQNQYLNKAYSQKNTFLSKFFGLIYPNIKIKVPNETLIPDSEKPVFITPLDKRICGFNKDSLFPKCEYLFGVIAHFQRSPTFLYLSLLTPPSPRKRIVTANPTEGEGFMTKFNIGFSLDNTNGIDNGNYQLFRRDCPSLNDTVAVLITRSLGASNVFSTFLAPGLKRCDYQVEIIVRVTEYDDYTDCVAPIITVRESQKSKEEMLKQIVTSLTEVGRVSSVDEMISSVSEVVNFGTTEATSNAQDSVSKIMDIISNIDGINGVVMSMLDNDKKMQMLNMTASIMSGLINKNMPNVNMNTTLNTKDKIGSYLTTAKSMESGSSIFSSCINTLSGVAEFGGLQKQNYTFFSSMESSLAMMSDKKLEELQPGAPAYNLTSPSIEMATRKNYADDLNNQTSIESGSGTQANLPAGFGAFIIASLLQSNTKNGSGGRLLAANAINTKENVLTVGTSLVSTGYNPFPSMKTNTSINAESINNASTQVLTPETIDKIYTDLSRGKMKDIVNPDEMGSNIMKFSLSPFQLSQNAIETKVNNPMNLGSLPNGTSAEFTLKQKDTELEYGNNTILVPMFYDRVNGTWSNKNCSVKDPNKTNGKFNANCSHLGTGSISNVNEAFNFAMDVIKDVINIVKAGNYDMLYNFAAFKKTTTINIIIYVIAAVFVTVFSFTEFYLKKSDKLALTEAKIQSLVQRYKPRTKLPYPGLLLNAFTALSQIRKKGMHEFSKEAQKTIVPFKKDSSVMQPEPNEKNEEEKLEIAPNGFTILTEKEEKDLKGLYIVYSELIEKCMCPPNIAVEVLVDVMEDEPVLQRITQVSLDDEIINDDVTFFILLRNIHPLFNALLKTDITNPRPIKFFIMVAGIIAQFFVTGYFYDPNDTSSVEPNQAMIAQTVVLSIAGILITSPLKVVMSVFLTGKSLEEKMKREEIEKIEAKTQIFRKIGIFAGCCLFVGCFYGILMFTIGFSEQVLSKWLITFWTSSGSDIVIIQQLKIIATVSFGLILMCLAKAKFMVSVAGVISGYVVSFIMNYF